MLVARHEGKHSMNVFKGFSQKNAIILQLESDCKKELLFVRLGPDLDRYGLIMGEGVVSEIQKRFGGRVSLFGKSFVDESKKVIYFLWKLSITEDELVSNWDLFVQNRDIPEPVLKCSRGSNRAYLLSKSGDLLGERVCLETRMFSDLAELTWTGANYRF